MEARIRMEWLMRLNDLLWQWILPVGLILTALVCGIAQKFAPLRGNSRLFVDTCGSLFGKCPDKTSGDSAPSQRQIVATALAAAMGTGNLIGTAAALAAGGAGAIFWMWISAFAGMLLVYAENVLGIFYRRKTKDGWCGGAIACLRYGLHAKRLALVFSVCCAMAGLGMGSMAQANAIAAAAKQFSVAPPVTAGICFVTGFVILRGGTKKIGHITVWLMPMLCGIYVLGCSILLIRNAARIPAAFAGILRGAFGFRPMAGGFSAAILMQSLRVGMRRGIFSNEAGLGSSALLHMEADGNSPDIQGKWAAVEVFADTIICCTLTALVILTAPSLQYTSETDGAALLLAAFTIGFGSYAGDFLAVVLMLFAFATMIGWYPCGAAAFRAVFRKKSEDIYRMLYLLMCLVGALGEPAWIYAVCDCCNAWMAIPNCIGLWKLRGTLAAETERIKKAYEDTECQYNGSGRKICNGA